MLRDHPRIVVVGTSCSGKTTLARQMAAALNRSHVELDALHWGTNWSVRSEFVDAVKSAISAEEWVVDGNYRSVRDLVWTRATGVVWLNYPFAFVFRRAIIRTVSRLISRETLYAGNRESFRGAFLAADGIPWWVIRTHGRRRREYSIVFSQERYQHLEVFELKSHADAMGLLAELAETCGCA